MPEPVPMRLMTLLRWPLAAFALLAVLAACATPQRPGDALDATQYAWSAAIRWGDFEGAVNLLDPKQRETGPPTPLELERYKQVRISAYREMGATRNLEQGTAQRDIEIGVINRHTEAERTLRYRETWRYDAAAKSWWVTSGLPDLWAGQ